MKKGICGLVIIAAFLLAAAFALFGCNNYFHDLIPPNDDRIISFFVEGQIGETVISDNEITVIVDKAISVDNIIPNIKVSHKAALFPLTHEYLGVAFPNVDVLTEAAAIYNAYNPTDHVMNLIARNPDFNTPVLDRPIDFTGPVNFLVVSGQGNIRQYTVYVVKDTGEPRLLGMGFSKYDNPELIRDAYTTVNENAKTIQSAVLYPVEMEISYALIPSFEILGDKLEVDGVEVRSRVDAIQFNKTLGGQSKTLTVWRNGLSVDYTLMVLFAEDPDSIRSIIDFRFNRPENPGIAATAAGSIYNSNALGTINVQVFYSGARPSILVPSFLSPGIVSVAGVTQISGSSSHDLSQTLEYRVISRNNLYMRTYTVVVDFIDIASAAPSFISFKFSSGLNHELVQDTEAQISESAGLIMLTARYGGSSAPDMLIPEFRATGLVTVFGSVQTSGFSAQNFFTQIKYTVTNPENPLLKRDYWVKVSFIRDTSSDALINSFSFHPDENHGLAEELTGRIDQNAGTITIFAPIGSGAVSRTMIPRFHAAGQVLVNGDVQISGTSGRLFNAPVIYEAVSANGVNRKLYTVTVRELRSTIFVNHAAFGMGDGTSWTDAFRNLKDALEAAAQFPADVPKEIWIAAGTYKPGGAGDVNNYFPLIANTSYAGGFAGWETAKSQRNVAANKVIISGDLGGGKYSNNLFGSFDGASASAVNGDLLFEDMEFRSARSGSGGRYNGAAIYAALADGFELRITGCSFNDLEASQGSAIYISGGILVIYDTVIENTRSRWQRGAVYGADLSGVEINGIGLYDITDNGIYISGGSGKREFSRVTGNRISSFDNNWPLYGIYVSGGSSFTLADSNFDTTGGIYFSSGGASIRVSDTEIKNVSGGSDGIRTSGGNTVIERVKVQSVSDGGSGISLDSAGIAEIIDCGIKSAGGMYGGIYLSSSGNAVISGTRIEDADANMGRGIYAKCNYLTVSNTVIKNAKAGGFGGGISITDTTGFIIEKSLFENCRSSIMDGAINVNGNSSNREIRDTKFLNIAAGGSKFMTLNGAIRFIRCTFEDDNSINNEDTGDYVSSMFGSGEGYFEECTFINLTNTHNGEKYIFNRYGNYNIGGGFTYTVSTTPFKLTLKDCVFNFNSNDPGAAGMLALYGGQAQADPFPFLEADQLLMDNVRINQSNSVRPLIWLRNNNVPGTFRFSSTNTYNGGTLNISSNLIRLENGAMPVPVN